MPRREEGIAANGGEGQRSFLTSCVQLHEEQTNKTLMAQTAHRLRHATPRRLAGRCRQWTTACNETKSQCAFPLPTRYTHPADHFLPHNAIPRKPSNSGSNCAVLNHCRDRSLFWKKSSAANLDYIGRGSSNWFLVGSTEFIWRLRCECRTEPVTLQRDFLLVPAQPSVHIPAHLLDEFLMAKWSDGIVTVVPHELCDVLK